MYGAVPPTLCLDPWIDHLLEQPCLQGPLNLSKAQLQESSLHPCSTPGNSEDFLPEDSLGIVCSSAHSASVYWAKDELLDVYIGNQNLRSASVSRRACLLQNEKPNRTSRLRRMANADPTGTS